MLNAYCCVSKTAVKELYSSRLFIVKFILWIQLYSMTFTSWENAYWTLTDSVSTTIQVYIEVQQATAQLHPRQRSSGAHRGVDSIISRHTPVLVGSNTAGPIQSVGNLGLLSIKSRHARNRVISMNLKLGGYGRAGGDVNIREAQIDITKH